MLFAMRAHLDGRCVRQHDPPVPLDGDIVLPQRVGRMINAKTNQGNSLLCGVAEVADFRIVSFEWKNDPYIAIVVGSGWRKALPWQRKASRGARERPSAHRRASHGLPAARDDMNGE